MQSFWGWGRGSRQFWETGRRLCDYSVGRGPDEAEQVGSNQSGVDEEEMRVLEHWNTIAGFKPEG